MSTIEFSLNVFTEFAEFSDKNICHYSKRAWTCHPATSCVRDQDATPVPARHMWETRSLNWAQFRLQWFIRFPEFNEFLFHLGKTPMSWITLGHTGVVCTVRRDRKWSNPRVFNIGKTSILLHLVDQNYLHST